MAPHAASRNRHPPKWRVTISTADRPTTTRFLGLPSTRPSFNTHSSRSGSVQRILSAVPAPGLSYPANFIGGAGTTDRMLFIIGAISRRQAPAWSIGVLLKFSARLAVIAPSSELLGQRDCARSPFRIRRAQRTHLPRPATVFLHDRRGHYRERRSQRKYEHFSI